MEEEQIRETIKYPCRKCLLREMDKNAYMENLYAYIDRIEGDSKADKAVYEDRLAVCKECKYLNEGLCGAFGCFVELRAVIAVNRCPYVKWSLLRSRGYLLRNIFFQGCSHGPHTGA